MSVHALVVKPSVFHARICSLMDICKSACAHILAYAHVCDKTSADACVRVCMYMCYVHVRVCVLVHVCVYACVRACACMRACVCLFRGACGVCMCALLARVPSGSSLTAA